MASKFMRGARMNQLSLHLTHKQQQTPWICNVYRSATWFSNSSGPVRYIPRVRKQNPAQRQDEHTNTRLNLSMNDERKSAHVRKVPSEAHKGITDYQQKAGAHARSGSCSDEIASIQRSCESSEQRETSSSELVGAQMSTQHMPADNKEGEPIYNVPTNEIQMGNRDVDKFEDMGQTREKDLFSLKAEAKAFFQVSKESPPLSVQGKHDKKREADLKGRSSLPWQDAESFLLKIQRAKQRSLEPCRMPHTAAIENSRLDGNNDMSDRECIDDDGFLLFEQDTLEQSEDVQGAPKMLDLHSMAEQEHAKNQAVRYLSMRPYTASQLRKKLIDKRIAPDLADYAVTTLQSCGLQSDLAYAETFSTGRFNRGSWGPQRIKLGLKQRGISDEIIKAAIDKVFCEEEGNMEQDEDVARAKVVKMSKAAMDHLLLQATKQWKRGRDASIDTKTRRMVCWLQYRGFNYSVIKRVLSHLQKETPLEDEH